jgi:hypothetical protein
VLSVGCKRFPCSVGTGNSNRWIREENSAEQGTNCEEQGSGVCRFYGALCWAIYQRFDRAARDDPRSGNPEEPFLRVPAHRDVGPDQLSDGEVYVRQSPGRWIDPRGEQAYPPQVTLLCLLQGGGSSCFMPSTPEEPQMCAGDDAGRCELVREICHQNCVNYFEEGQFPGRDQFAGYRRCMRECMAARDCPY